MKSITIVLADDHAFTLDGMRQALSQMDGCDVVGWATNGIEAISVIKRTQPDCALLDLSMPGANGLETLIEAKRWSPKTHFVIITGNPSSAIFNQLLEAGVKGLFLKNAPPSEICEGILKIASGRQVISKAAQKIISESTTSSEMTAREIEVLQCIARGQSNNQIGEHLGVSPKTVDSHRTSLMKKMDVHSTAALLVRAMKDGLIDV
ncbi:MAG: response regulator transcription factor [Salaquimonas sp.]